MRDGETKKARTQAGTRPSFFRQAGMQVLQNPLARSPEESREVRKLHDCSQEKSESGKVSDIALVCLACGKTMIPVKCKLVCECGYFESCSDLEPHPPRTPKTPDPRPRR